MVVFVTLNLVFDKERFLGASVGWLCARLTLRIKV